MVVPVTGPVDGVTGGPLGNTVLGGVVLGGIVPIPAMNGRDLPLAQPPTRSRPAVTMAMPKRCRRFDAVRIDAVRIEAVRIEAVRIEAVHIEAVRIDVMERACGHRDGA